MTKEVRIYLKVWSRSWGPVDNNMRLSAERKFSNALNKNGLIEVREPSIPEVLGSPEYRNKWKSGERLIGAGQRP